LKGAGRLLGPAAYVVDAYNTGRQVFNPQDNIITSAQRLGAGISNLIQGRPYLSGSRISQSNPGQYYGPAYASSEAMGLPSTQGLRNYGSGYKEEELAQGRKAEAFRPGAGFPGQQGAADRAYEAEKSRVAQLTAQDPELQRYEAARLKAVAPGATQEQVQSAEDIGMQIWQQKYGNTPMGRPGGAVGTFNPLMDRTFGYQSGMAPDQLAEMQKTAAPIPVAPGAVPYQAGDLGTRATLETGYDPAAYGLTPDKIQEMKNKLLQQASK
jgi:hypothetical protein